MADKVRLGFIGCGGVQQMHLEGVARIEEADITAVCDLKQDLAQETGAKYNAKPFTDHKQMLADVELDAVYIALPPFAHGLELDVIEKGLPFFVEKPVGMDLKLCREIAAGVKEKNLTTAVGYMSRYRAGVKRAKEIFNGDPPILLHGGWVGGTPNMTAPIHQWWVVKEKSGGQLVEQTTHTVDLVRYFCGDVAEVYAAATKGFVTGIPTFTIDDASLVTFKFKDGAIATLYSTCAANGGGGGVSLNVYALQHTIKLGGWALDAEILTKGAEPEKFAGEQNIFEIEDRVFIKAVKTGDRSDIMTDYADGVKTAAAAIAANQSMETGKPVTTEE
ncbi:MAG: Gfo/Idh/MocA family oxidoreductase [Planctomycetes bacterium]|nr:Gfo/Idh/MocA family oxidoreductase [Planctomycetota bacterium]